MLDFFHQELMKLELIVFNAADNGRYRHKNADDSPRVAATLF